MQLRLLSIFIFLFALVSCVGTVQESNQNFTNINNGPSNEMAFAGIFNAVAISDTKIEVFFYPAGGGSGKFTYDIIVGSSPYPISIPSDVLSPDYRGILKTTVTGLSRLSTYQIKVEVRDDDTGAQSNSQLFRTVTTFDNEVADFAGISSGSNMPGQDGKDSLKIRWTPARTSGGLTKKDWDPKSYEIVIVDAAKLTPNDMDVNYSTADGRWVYQINFDTGLNEYIVRGLPSQTKFYIRMRTIHEASIDDLYNPKKRSELNSNYITISTLSADLADIDFQTDSFGVTLAPGEQGLNAVIASWSAATGVFDHYRLYYGLEGSGVASGSFPSLCLSPILSDPSETVFCKKADFLASSSPITGLLPYNTYEVVLVLCATSACTPDQQIIGPVRTVTLDPTSPTFNGAKELTMAQTLSDVVCIYINFDPPNFTRVFFDGIILKLRRTFDGSVAVVEITTSTNPTNHLPYNFISDNQIIIKGINYLEEEPFCFTLYPYKWDSDGVTKRESPNGIWKCISPKAEAPTSQQFVGLKTGSTDLDAVTVNWDTPNGGIFSHYELFWRKQSGAAFSWGDALAQAGNSYNYTNYGRILIDQDENSITMPGFADGTYIFGMITYFTYVTDDGVITMRSETNGGLRTCRVDSAAVDPINCN
jgi:hypothetical protein